MSEEQIKNPKIGGVKMADLPKEHIRLPQLHFVAAMDWIDKLGEKAFCGYLKLFTMADRRGKSLKDDSATVPKSLELIAKEIGCSKGTLYEKVIKPLWNFGLIDLEEYEGSSRKTTKPVNIVVLPYPNMEFSNMVEKLVKVRDYDLDYNSVSRIHARKKPKKTEVDTVQKLDGIETGDKKENIDFNTVQKLDGRPSKNRTVDRLKIEHSNIINSSNNAFNYFINLEEEEEARALLNNHSLKLLNDLCVTAGFPEDMALKIVFLVNQKQVSNLTEEVILGALEKVQDELNRNYIKGDVASWTAVKIQKEAQQPKLKVVSENPKQPKDPKKPKYGNGRGNYQFTAVRTELLPDWFDGEPQTEEEKNLKLLQTFFINSNNNADKGNFGLWLVETANSLNLSVEDHKGILDAYAAKKRSEFKLQLGRV